MGWLARRRENQKVQAYDDVVDRLMREKGGERLVEDAIAEDRGADSGEGQPGDQ